MSSRPEQYGGARQCWCELTIRQGWGENVGQQQQKARITYCVRLTSEIVCTTQEAEYSLIHLPSNPPLIWMLQQQPPIRVLRALPGGRAWPSCGRRAFWRVAWSMLECFCSCNWIENPGFFEKWALLLQGVKGELGSILGDRHLLCSLVCEPSVILRDGHLLCSLVCEHWFVGHPFWVTGTFCAVWFANLWALLCCNVAIQIMWRPIMVEHPQLLSFHILT